MPTSAPFSYTTADPFYSVSTDENGNPEYGEDGELVYDMTRLGRLASVWGCETISGVCRGCLVFVIWSVRV